MIPLKSIKLPVVSIAAAVVLSATPRGVPANEGTFDEVALILTQHCVRCHNDIDHEGDFSLQTFESLVKSGFVVPEDASSHLLSVIQPDGDSPPLMPKEAPALSKDQVATIRAWIESGAAWNNGVRLDVPVSGFDWWSFQPMSRPAVPDSGSGWARTPIDEFVLAKLKDKGLQHGQDADPRTLIRRLTYDLIGLPPTPEEIATFTNDSDPRAYEKLVDRLLNSQHYGERWARHWLDVVKYADTCGYDKDKLRPHAWPYRDYVIRSFNADKPYSRFVQEQIAGDKLFPDDPDGILGLGFVAAGPWDFIGHVEVAESKIDGRVARNLDRDEMVSNAINTFCSVTIQCARCHNHKFDPFTQEHYYSLQSVFAAVDRADRVYAIDPDVEAKRKLLADSLSGLEGELAVLKQSTDGGDADELRLLTESIEKARKELSDLPDAKLVYAAATEFKPQSNFKPTHGKPRPVHLLHRGNVEQPGEEVAAGRLPLTGDDDWRFDPQLGESERRAQLAQWLTRDDHPLVWRSIVNRVWQYHFGQGLVATPNDFGRMGATPTHPRLLDWLACEFRDQGQSLKYLHRMIVTSSVYRQSSNFNESNALIDGSNQFLWRMTRRRLSAEEIRDSILSVSGSLDTTMGGPGFYLFALEKSEHSPHYEYHKFDPTNRKSHRRSVYRFVARSQPNPYLTTLDCADSSQSTPKRLETLTSLQSLSLLNNKFNLAMAEIFSDRLRSETDHPAEQVDRAMYLVTGRLPTRSERELLVQYGADYGLDNLCRMMFNLSEFVFLD